jgi:hypothetical protein
MEGIGEAFGEVLFKFNDNIYSLTACVDLPSLLNQDLNGFSKRGSAKFYGWKP